MAAEASAPSSDSQSSFDKEFNDKSAFQLINAVNPGNSVISLSFVTAREISGDNFDELKAFIAAHFTEHFQTPIHQVNLSVNVLDNNIMATPVEYDSPAPTEDTDSPEVALDTEHEATNSAASKNAKQKVPRPPNAFIIYRKEWHPIVVAANPGVHNNIISVIIGKKWKNESKEIRDKYQHKAAEAKYQHLMANPGYQYQPRKPSEKKKRMTKTKLAKLAAKSAAAAKSVAPAQPAPLVTLNEDNSMVTFYPGKGDSNQLTAELNAFNNSKFTAAQLAYHQVAAGQVPFPSVAATQCVADSVVMDDTSPHPIVPTAQNFFGLVNHAAFTDPFSDANYQATQFPPALDDIEVVIPGYDNLGDFNFDTEVLRQVAVNEEFNDGLNDLFDFEGFALEE